MTENTNKLVAALVSVIMISVMNGTMFNIAVPTIAVQFHLTPSQVSWVVTAYALVFAIGAVTYGKLADIYPVRLLITIGLILFALGAMVGFIGTSYPVVIVGRIIQAAGGSAIPALAMIVATRFFPPDKRGRVLGYIASAVALGSGLGPIIGGAVAQFLSWRYLFLVSAFGLGAIPFLRAYLPRENRKDGFFDVKGAVLFAAAVSFTLLFINQVNLLYLVLSILSFALFTRQIKKAEYPFIEISLLRNRTYSLLLMVGFLTFGAMLSTFFIIPLMLKQVNGLNAGVVGLVVFPGALTAALFGSYAGRLADRLGSPAVLKIAIFLMFLGFLSLSTFAGFGPWFVAVGLIVPYIGFASIQSSLAKYVSMVLEDKVTGVGMGVYNLSTFISGAVATAFVGFFLEQDFANTWNPLNNISQHQYTNVFIVLALFLVTSYGLLYFADKGISKQES